MAPSWLPLAPLWLPLAPSGSLWLLTDSIGPFKQLECMVPFRYLWPTTTTHATGVVVPRKLSPIFNFGVGELLAPFPSGSLWLSLAPFGSLVRGSLWLPLAPSGSLWFACGFLWIPGVVGVRGSLWLPCGSIWLPLACLRIPLAPSSSWSTGLPWAPLCSLWLPLACLWLAYGFRWTFGVVGVRGSLVAPGGCGLEETIANSQFWGSRVVGFIP